VVAAVGLVAAVWISLVLARSGDVAGAAASTTGSGTEAATGSTTGATRAAGTLGDVPGFRADAWYLPDDPTLGFVEIPGGAFTMGSDPARDPASFDVEWWSPAGGTGTVDVPTFWIARYETTVAQYAVFVAATGRAVPDPSLLRARPDLPMVSVASVG
jgi:formylglycine-generating enzyme required for sulfatase activity